MRFQVLVILRVLVKSTPRPLPSDVPATSRLVDPFMTMSWFSNLLTRPSRIAFCIFLWPCLWVSWASHLTFAYLSFP